MPVIMIQGDLLKSDCDIIAHGCNCYCTFGSGIAKQIKETFPEAYEADLETDAGDVSKLGTHSWAYCKKEGREGSIRVVNLYTQFKYGRDKRYVDYEALFNCLQQLRGHAHLQSQFQRPKVGIPKIGCGLAGGRWPIVRAMIEEVFDKEDIYVYHLP